MELLTNGPDPTATPDEEQSPVVPPDEFPEGTQPEPDASPGSLTPERRTSLLAYCKLTELEDDPEVAALIPVLYAAAVGYMENAGVSAPEPGTTRAAQYDLCVNYLVLDAWERRETNMVATVVADNPMFRNLMNQLKWT